MNILLIGSGAREHALAWKMRQSDIVDTLWVWPGSPSMSGLAKKLDIGLDATMYDVARLAKNQDLDFVVVGPEQPLADGIADACAELRLPCFGPVKAAARLESSKAFAKEVMAAAKIPTAAFQIVQGEAACRDGALNCLKRTGGAVIKASGLASGKGVFVCTTEEEIEGACQRLYRSGMAKAAETVVIEEILKGRECSFFVFLGEGSKVSLGFAVDHKRLQDEDKGPNTGGMGCYTPVPWLPNDAEFKVMQSVVEPLCEELKKRGITYTGCLYVGLMWNENGPSVVEFNVRLGDPEAEVLALHDRRDWARLIAAKVGLLPDDKDFARAALSNTGASVAVVLASSCYPFGEGVTHKYQVSPSLFNNEKRDYGVFAAAVRQEQDKLVTGKGRLLTLVAHGADFTAARQRVYSEIDGLTKAWQGVQFRRDIAHNVEMI